MCLYFTLEKAGGKQPLSDNDFPGTTDGGSFKKKLPANKLEKAAILDSLCS